jgi:hypothetical protein
MGALDAEAPPDIEAGADTGEASEAEAETPPEE